MTVEELRGWSELDDESRAAARELAERLIVPLHRLGVDEARSLMASVPRDEPLTKIYSVERRTAPTRAGNVAIRIYRPSAPTARSRPAPVLLYAHGGGFTIGTLEGADEVCRLLAVEAACVVISIEYRLAPEHPYPGALEDCLDVCSWARSERAALGIDPTRVAVGGDSAGATLASAMCLALRDARETLPVLQVLAYPTVDCVGHGESWTQYADGPLITSADVSWFWQQYVGADAMCLNAPLSHLAAPMRAHSVSGLPRAHVATAAVDPLRDDAEAYAHRLRDEGVEVRLIRYPGVFHGFFTEVGVFSRTQEALRDAAASLREAFATSNRPQ